MMSTSGSMVDPSGPPAPVRDGGEADAWLIFFLGLLAAGGIGFVALPALRVGRTMGATVSSRIEWGERQEEVARAPRGPVDGGAGPGRREAR